MAAIVANPYYDDPFLSSIASNISRAFIDRNPGQTAAGRAHARLYGLQADEIEGKRAARGTIGQIFLKPGGANGTYTPEQVQQITAAGVTGGYDPKEASQYYLFNAANSGQPTSSVVRALSGTGQVLGKDQSVTQEQQREIISRDEATRKSVASIGAGPGYAGVAQREREANARLEYDKQYPEKSRVEGKLTQDYTNQNPQAISSVIFKPIPLSPGQTAVGVEGDPRMPSGTFTNQKALPPFVLPPGASAVVPEGSPYRSERGATVMQGNEKPARPGDINSPKEVSDAEWNILSKIGAVGSDGKIDPAFLAEYGELMPDALAAMGAPGNNAGSAESVYLKRLGVPPGSTWGSTGWFGTGGKKLTTPPRKPSPVVGAVTGGGGPAPAAGPGAPKIAPADALAQARAAIAQGKPRELVIQRLQQLGISPEGL
jgi:hypothetical protein